jgi:hypothetical protein
VKTSVIKQPAGLCRSNEFRSIFRNAKDFVGRDPVFLRLSQRQEFGSTAAHARDRRRMISANQLTMLLAQNPWISWLSGMLRPEEQEQRIVRAGLPKSPNSGKLDR